MFGFFKQHNKLTRGSVEFKRLKSNEMQQDTEETLSETVHLPLICLFSDLSQNVSNTFFFSANKLSKLNPVCVHYVLCSEENLWKRKQINSNVLKMLSHPLGASPLSENEIKMKLLIKTDSFLLVCHTEHKETSPGCTNLPLPALRLCRASHIVWWSWISVAPSDSALLCCVVELQRRLSTGIHATCCPG